MKSDESSDCVYVMYGTVPESVLGWMLMTPNCLSSHVSVRLQRMRVPCIRSLQGSRGAKTRLSFAPSFQFRPLIGRLRAEKPGSSQRLSRSSELSNFSRSPRPQFCPSCAISFLSPKPAPATAAHPQSPPRPHSPSSFSPLRPPKTRVFKNRESSEDLGRFTFAVPLTKTENVVRAGHEAIGPLDGPPDGPFRVDRQQHNNKGR